MRRRSQVEGVGPGQWVESTGRGGCQFKGCGLGERVSNEVSGRGGTTLRGGAMQEAWPGEWGGVTPESPLTPCLSLYPSFRDGAHGHPIPHGQSLPSVHGLRHQ